MDFNDSNDIIDETILEKHITKYIDGIGKILAEVFLFLFCADLIVSIVVYFGHLPFHMKTFSGDDATYNQFISWQFFTQFLLLIPFLIYFLSYKKASFSRKKSLLTFLTISTTTILCFGHWKNPYISFLFAIPVMITSPLDNKRNRITLVICELLIILYAFFHNWFHDPEINYLMAAVSTTTLVMFYIISLKIHRMMNGVFLEMREYKNIQEMLYDKIAHDRLTGAYSKTALETNLVNIEEYKTLAFIDIDNFKEINDNNGHDTGDRILKLFAFYMRNQGVEIYRYGGDEFVILSKTLMPEECYKILDVNRRRLLLASKKLYNCDVTLSVGIIKINKNETPVENIKRGDKLMYVSKNGGKNKISIEE